ncbi:MAG: four helix bundle protein [Bacteroidetes bacterium]|nr:four helix bundle protein [Bacteroidota bacterium]
MGERGMGGMGERGTGRIGERINTYKELHVYQNAMKAAMEIFELTKGFPIEEKYSMIDEADKWLIPKK